MVFASLGRIPSTQYTIVLHADKNGGIIVRELSSLVTVMITDQKVVSLFEGSVGHLRWKTS